MTEPRSAPVVVVGVDGSPAAERALEWATAYAESAGASLRVVCAWALPTSFGRPVPHEGFEPAVAARQVVEKAVAGLGLPADRVETLAPVGSAGEVLVDVSKDADLLVVGRHGHRTIVSHLLGSVSSYCAHHAQIPLVVIH